MSDWFGKNTESESSGGNGSYWDRPDAGTGRSVRDDKAKTKAGQDFFARVAAEPRQQVAVPPPTPQPVARQHRAAPESPTPGAAPPNQRSPLQPLPNRLLLVAAIAATIVAAAASLSWVNRGRTEAAAPLPPLQSPGETLQVDPVLEPPVPQCPALGDSLDQINAATYVVVAEIGQAGGGDASVFSSFGTAWAIDEHVLVTNAHVAAAFTSFPEELVLKRALAVQAGTGTVVTLTRELTHPNYDGDPLRSPDVALMTTLEALPAVLPLAPPDAAIELGDEVAIVGFPGDVTEFIEINPGETIPQATSLTGRITARRSHDDTNSVTDDNLDVIQHQAPTTPGTSGSSLVSCGAVIGVNNAGTVNIVPALGQDGELELKKQSAAANSFAVHHRHVRTLLTLFESNAIQGTDLVAGTGGN